MRIQEAQKHMDPTDPDPHHCFAAPRGGGGVSTLWVSSAVVRLRITFVRFRTLIEIQFFTYRYRTLGLKMTITIRYPVVFK
jgi:hypothetical protein